MSSVDKIKQEISSILKLEKELAQQREALSQNLLVAYRETYPDIYLVLSKSKATDYDYISNAWAYCSCLANAKEFVKSWDYSPLIQVVSSKLLNLSQLEKLDQPLISNQQYRVIKEQNEPREVNYHV